MRNHEHIRWYLHRWFLAIAMIWSVTANANSDQYSFQSSFSKTRNIQYNIVNDNEEASTSEIQLLEGVINNTSASIAPGIYWTGISSSLWNLTDNNWAVDANSSTMSGVWSNNGTAIFGDTTAVPGAVNLSETENISNLVFNSNSGAFTLFGGTLNVVGAATITNNGTAPSVIDSPLILPANSLTLNGPGKVILSGMIDGGNSSATIINNTTLTWSGNVPQTINGPISGTGSLIVASSSTLSLTNQNSYLGGTTISKGTLRLYNVSPIGYGQINLGDVNTSNNNLSLLIAGGSSVNNPILVPSNGGSTGTITIGSFSAGTNTTFNGNLILNHDVVLVDNSGDKTSFFGTISGNGNILIAGKKIAVNQQNTFVGQITVLADSTFQVERSDALNSNDMTINGIYQSYGVPSAQEIIGALNGSGTVRTTTTDAQNLYIGMNNHNGIFTGSINGSTLTVTKVGTGVQTLSGVNTFGQAVVFSGTLNFNGSAASTFNVYGGTLTGTGTNTGPLNVTDGGALTPGNGGVGRLSAGDTYVDNVSSLNISVGSNQTQLAVTGNIVLAGTLNVAANPGITARTYTIVTYTGFSLVKFSKINLPTGYAGYVSTQIPGEVDLIVYPLFALNNTWGPNSTSGDTMTVATIGASINAAITSTATATGNTSLGNSVGKLQVGQTIVLPAPTISPASSYNNYTISVTCTNSTRLSTSVFPAQFIATDTDVVNGVTCTYSEIPLTISISGMVLLDNGVGGGIANDGIQNGAETGISGVTIKLTNCASTIFNSTLTSSAGQFTLMAPIGTTGTLCIVKTPRTGFVAVSSNVGTTGGTYNAATDTLTFNAIASTNYGSIVLGEVNQSTFTGNASKTVAINGAVTYAHVYNAGNAASVLFTTSDAQNLPNQNWRSAIYLDASCSGSLASNPTIITAPISVKAGDQICLLINLTSAPNATNNTVNTTTITATETYTSQPTIGAVGRTFTLIDTTSIGTSNLSLTKQLRVVSACPANANQSTLDVSDIYATEINVTPGQFVQHLITYTNASASPITKLVVYDQVPAYTLFVNAFCVALPTSGISSCAVTTSPNVGGTGGVIWSMTDSPGAASGAQGGLNPGGKGSVSYCVQIQQ